jgi:beta-alanine degradation protein BauB
MSTDQKARFPYPFVTLVCVIALHPTWSHSADVPDALTAGWKGDKRCENLYEDAQLRILRCIFPPNVGHEAHSHPAHFSYVLSGGRGRATDSRGTREFESQADDFRVNKPVEWHEMVNTGDTTHRYLIVEKKYETDR